MHHHVLVLVGVTGAQEEPFRDLQTEIADLRSESLDFVEADDMADLDRHRLVLRNRRVREHGETTEMTRSHVDLR